ncbi:phytanoyl-CoA dioxygenase family protein [Paenibacillus sp. CF384]|uniref:phytanoyl-CoA dioxygenase family protein n=1 Tax=Paenibacillus sp. CF384 TaxID=1884382 RepID=UPI00089BAB3B|nr:phytanoyl-CoA dioxygenase family protein [Paenibacillus sp. CF384]SDX89224.1 Phytanoyl-CoA dioxygenase (PhyH) [Paenibacillus sp. CF384]
MKVSAEELASGKLLPSTIELAVQLIQVNGYVLIEEVLPRTQIDQLNNRIGDYLEGFMAKNGFSLEEGFHDGTNHIGMYLPFEHPFCDESLIAHPFVTDIVDQILGSDCELTYFASNTSMPKGTKSQDVHADTGARFGSRFGVNVPITNLVVNYPLVDVNDENGPMEVWPGGTHLHPDSWYSSKVLNKTELAPHMLSFKAHMPAGSIMIRDDRMWHRGTPNRSDKPRPNIALIYSSTATAPYQGGLQIPQETYDQFSDRAKQLVRKQKIGSEVIKPY